MNRKKLIEICRLLYVEADYELINDVEMAMEKFLKDLEFLKTFDVEGVEPFYRIHETSVVSFREDTVNLDGFSQDLAFKNFAKKQNGFVVIQRVVGDQKKR